MSSNEPSPGESVGQIAAYDFVELKNQGSSALEHSRPTEQTEARIERAEARMEQAEALTEQAEARIERAEARTLQVEARTEEAIRDSELRYRR
jgi:hypothetical protein